jgi:thymidylate synthase
MAYVYVNEETLPAAWERAVVRCWEEGDRARTEYDKAGDPESRDCTAMIVARRPFAEPRIHRAFPGSLEDLEIYRQEVVLGIHDHWVDPASGKWSYTYHQRMFGYDIHDRAGREQKINQFDYIIAKLAEAPHTRRAQAITWKVDVDPTVEDPACLQRMWFRIVGDELRLNVHMRSNDAFKAAFMNMWAFTDLQRYVAEEVAKRTGRQLRIGPYCHIADSFHIYGSYFTDFEGFLQTLQKRTFAERVWDSTTDLVQSCFAHAREMIEKEKGLPPSERKAGL